MPGTVLPYADRGLVTAGQPWSGSYRVNAAAWAIAHFTQFAWPATKGNPGGWRFVRSASGYLRGRPSAGRFTLTRGSPGIEVGGWYPAYFSNLNVTKP